MADPFIAEIKIFAGNFAPRGYSFCDGKTLPIGQNSALFSLLRTTYGGDGRTTVGLPNLQGRAPMHPGQGPGLSNRRLGQAGGTETETLTSDQLTSHAHTANGVDRDANSPDPTARLLGSTSEDFYANPDDHAGNIVAMATESLLNTGGNQPHNNMQPYQTLNYIIALVGTYPQRS
jgi:microcystin-dependent protein